MSGKIVFVSNRLPIHLERQKGRFVAKPSVGGLATGLGSYHRSADSLWIGWPGISSDSLGERERSDMEKVLRQEYRCVPVNLSGADMKLYYYGFCNKTVWPLFHYFQNYTSYEVSLWEAYKRVNRIFLQTVLSHVGEDDTLWIHDYQLMLLPGMVRERLQRVKVGFFLHIPFPSFEVFRLLPWGREIIEGLLGADLVGFHTYDYVRHFLSTTRRMLGYEHRLGQVLTENRIIKVDAFPMGIDFDRYNGSRSASEVKREMDRISERVEGRKVVLSIDRLDYTKGILKRLKSYEHFLAHNTGYHGKAVLILVAVPSRTGVETYMQLKRELDEHVGRINGEYGRIGWIPVWYLYRSLSFPTLCALYNLADAALVTPLRDGMNLIAKEYVASRSDGRGVLILSAMAGAAHEMGEALIVNPHNIEQVSSAIGEAIAMPVDEQEKRNRVMQERLKRYDVTRWARDFFERLEATRQSQEVMNEKRLTLDMQAKLIADYRSAHSRFLLLDYDGTLTPFSTKPELAKPDEELCGLLEALCVRIGNEVAIVSERERKVLDGWFGRMDLHIVAEYCAWMRKRSGGWRQVEPLRNDWKEEIRPVLQLYVDRTPGAFLEEKEHSLAWHYRNAEPEMAYVRVNELKETLLNLTQNLDLGIAEANRVLEVKGAAVHKGRAVLDLLGSTPWDFVLAIGDDVTDEEMFANLPAGAHSIKVGLGISQARSNMLSVREVRELLAELTR